jgi:membrane fusion protein (multidrug efflux system)
MHSLKLVSRFTALWLTVALMVVLSLGPAGCATSGQAATTEEGASTASSAKTAEETSPEDGADREAEEKEEEAVPVEVVTLDRGRIEEVLRFSANLEAESHVQVFSQAARLVRELLVEEGDRVRQGQPLLRLQDEEQRNNLAKVRSQFAKARRESQRLERLFAENLISEQDFNEAAYELEQLQIAVADAERELGYTEVKAPIDGTVTSRLVRLGDQVKVGQHLFDIVDFDSMVARVYVPEKNLARLHSGQPARISAQAVADRRYAGVVERIAPVVDPKTGTIKVTVAVGGQPGLLPGLYVDVALVTAVHEDAVLVPKRALVYDQDRVFVYRLSGDRHVEKIAVEPVLSDRENVEPRERLAQGDQVVVAGQAGLKNGALVELPGDEDDEEPAGEGSTVTASTDAHTAPAAASS